MERTPLAAVRGLHLALLDAWNRQDADGFARLFTADGESIGFQNTPAAYHGRPELAEQLTAELSELVAGLPA